MSIIPISDSGPMKAEVAKQLGNNAQKEGTNLKVTPQSEQSIYNTAYGKDGMLLSKGERYDPAATILPNSELEKSRRELKEEEKKKKQKKKKKKKQDFWEWLLAK